MAAGSRIEVFVDGVLVYSNRANGRASANGYRGTFHGNGRVVPGNGKGARFVSGNGRRPVSGKREVFREGNAVMFNGPEPADGSGRRFVPPSQAGSGNSGGGY
jgi:hypothetical protein